MDLASFGWCFRVSFVSCLGERNPFWLLVYTDISVISTGRIHKYPSNILCTIYIDFRVILLYNGVGGENVPIEYKGDILALLRSAGYNTTKLRREKLLSEGVIQALREKKPISWANLERICSMLRCQPGDILVSVPDNTGEVV